MVASIKWQKHSVLIWLVLIMVAVHLVNSYTGGALMQFGIFPRNVSTLWHIFTAPFIHGNLMHLVNNLIGLVIFGTLCLLQSVNYFFKTSLFIIVVTGLLVWLFGREAMHIGASGWIYGLWSLCIVTAWYNRSFSNIVVAFAVIFFYGGMVYGVLPLDPSVSFESHLFGVIAGALAAAVFKGRTRGRWQPTGKQKRWKF